MTISEMKADCKAHGKHTFDDDTMRFFGCKIHTAPDRYGIYLDSISDWYGEKRIYCVRAYDKRNGESVTFNSIKDLQFSTYEEAKKCARHIRYQIVGGFDHFEYNYDGGVSIVYKDGNEQPVRLEF